MGELAQALKVALELLLSQAVPLPRSVLTGLGQYGPELRDRFHVLPGLSMVLGQHRYEVADPVVSGEPGEQGDADVHHALSLRDHDRAPPKPGQPMPLARVVPLDAMRLVFARMKLSARQEHVINHVIVG